MTTNQAPSTAVNTNANAAAPTIKRTAHEHTLASAVECFDYAVQNNIARHKEPLAQAVRRALPWGHNTLLAQIKDPEHKKNFEAFLARKRNEHPKPLREERPRGPALITAAEVKAKLEASPHPFGKVTALFRNRSLWDPTQAQQIEETAIAVLQTAKRDEFVRNGIVLTAQTIDDAAKAAKEFVARAKRTSQPQQPSGNRRPQGNGGNNRGPSNFTRSVNHAERKTDEPKVTGKPSNLESQASRLKRMIADLESDLKKARELGDNPDPETGSVVALKSLKQELVEVRAKISADYEARAATKKKERIAHAEASAKASLTVPTSYKTKDQPAKPEEKSKGKGKKKR